MGGGRTFDDFNVDHEPQFPSLGQIAVQEVDIGLLQPLSPQSFLTKPLVQLAVCGSEKLHNPSYAISPPLAAQVASIIGPLMRFWQIFCLECASQGIAVVVNLLPTRTRLASKLFVKCSHNADQTASTARRPEYGKAQTFPSATLYPPLTPTARKL